MNKKIIVDYLEKLYPDAHCELNHQNNYELLIAIILSAQTTDKKVNDVTNILFPKYPSFYALSLADSKEVEEILHPLGLAKTKAYNIIKTSQIIKSDFSGQIPTNEKDLLKLPGVGNKVAWVYLGEAEGRNVFPVDTHIKRIAGRLGISKNDNPDKISEDLKKYFKGEDYMHLHHRLIFFGRYLCKAKGPNCSVCELKCKISKNSQIKPNL